VFRVDQRARGYVEVMPTPTAQGYLGINVPMFGRQWFIRLEKLVVFLHTGRQYKKVICLDQDPTNLRWANLVYTQEVVQTEVEERLWKIHMETFKHLQQYREQAKMTIMAQRKSKLEQALLRMQAAKVAVGEEKPEDTPSLPQEVQEKLAKVEHQMSPLEGLEYQLRKENLEIRYKYGVGDTPTFRAIQEFYTEAITAKGEPAKSPSDYLKENSTEGMTWENYQEKVERWEWDLLKCASLLHWVKENELTPQLAEREYIKSCYKGETAGFVWGQLVPPLREKFEILRQAAQ